MRNVKNEMARHRQSARRIPNLGPRFPDRASLRRQHTDVEKADGSVVRRTHFHKLNRAPLRFEGEWKKVWRGSQPLCERLTGKRAAFDRWFSL